MSSNQDHTDIVALHTEIDGVAQKLEAHHHARLKCRSGCAACCVDDLTVFDVEADRIRADYADLLESGEAHAPGACAFLSADDTCRIYAARPYVCRTQGLPLRWVEEGPDGWVEHRDICELNDEGSPITELREGECWTLGPAEQKLYVLQTRRGNANRVPLRSLFHGTPASESSPDDRISG